MIIVMKRQIESKVKKIYDEPKTPYQEFNTFEKELFTLFPTVARLTGSTTDSLIYASHYTPSKMRELLRLFVEF